MRENAVGSIFPSVIEPAFARAIAHVIARICEFFSPITDGETDAAVEMIQLLSQMEKGIHLRFHTSRTGQQTQKVNVEKAL
jgi:hypothetical protein